MPKWLVILLILLSACNREVAEEGMPSEQSQQGEVPTGSETAVYGRGQALPEQASARDEWIEKAFLPSESTRDTLIAAFGEPDRTLAEPVTNGQDPTATDTVFQLVWDSGLTAWVNRGGGSEFIARAEVRGNDFLRRADVGIGTTWQEVVEEFGPPWGEFEGLPYYDSGRRLGPEEPVYFQVEDGMVRLIRFDYYTG